MHLLSTYLQPVMGVVLSLSYVCSMSCDFVECVMSRPNINDIRLLCVSRSSLLLLNVRIATKTYDLKVEEYDLSSRPRLWWL